MQCLFQILPPCELKLFKMLKHTLNASEIGNKADLKNANCDRKLSLSTISFSSSSTDSMLTEDGVSDENIARQVWNRYTVSGADLNKSRDLSFPVHGNHLHTLPEQVLSFIKCSQTSNNGFGSENISYLQNQLSLKSFLGSFWENSIFHLLRAQIWPKNKFFINTCYNNNCGW